MVTADDPVAQLRAICLALPEATEQETWEAPTFRVRGKIFAMPRQRDDHAAFWCKARPGVQTILVGSDPYRFFVPPYVGHKGWIGVRLEAGVDWGEVAELIEESYRMTAPKRLAALLNTGDEDSNISGADDPFRPFASEES